jgi:hypothetical protein
MMASSKEVTETVKCIKSISPSSVIPMPTATPRQAAIYPTVECCHQEIGVEEALAPDQKYWLAALTCFMGLLFLWSLTFCSLGSFLRNAFTLVTHWGVKEGFTHQYGKRFNGAGGFDALLVFLFANRAAYASRIPHPLAV